MRWLRLVLICSFFFPLTAATFFVGPKGNDGWSGLRVTANFSETDGPLATLSAALKAARALRQTAPGEASTIELLTGRYELAEPLVFTPDDSGLTIQAHSGTKPVLSGGTRLIGWKQSSANPALWQVTLSEVREGKRYFRQLFLNGERQQRARTPNTGYFRARAKLGEKPLIEVPFQPSEIRPAWTNGAEFLMLMKWTTAMTP